MIKIKISSEAKIGLIFVVAFVFFIWGINFLKGQNLLKKTKTYFAVYDNVSGLTEANPVLILGYQVGQVDDIIYLQKKKKILVRMSLQKRVGIPVNTTARIFNSSIMGTKAIDLLFYDTTVVYNEGDTLISDIESGLAEQITAGVTPLKEKTERVLSYLDTILTEVFNNQARSDIRKTLRHIEKTTATLDEQREMIKATLENLYLTTKIIKDSRGKIANAIDNFENLSDSLADANLKTSIENTNRSIQELNNLLLKLNEGNGTMGMLMNDDSLYVHLDMATRNLSTLLEDMKNYPKDYVHFSLFGRKDKRPK